VAERLILRPWVLRELNPAPQVQAAVFAMKLIYIKLDAGLLLLNDSR
jgi:hypothetical protein